MKLTEIAEFLGGEISGDAGLDISGVAGIEEATRKDITFLADKKHLPRLQGSNASCVMVSDFLADAPGGMAQLKVQNPYLCFARLLGLFYEKPAKPMGVSPMAFVSEHATLESDISVHPFASICQGASIGRGSVVGHCAFIGENTRIGQQCVIYPNVVIREGVTVGDRVIIHAGAVIGADGFGYVSDGGVHHKIPQVGGVLIGDDVEVGANAAIDRATIGNTVLGNGCKIDNLVHIAHNVKIGQGTVLAALVGIAGSSTLGKYVSMGGMSGVADHCTVQDGTMIGGQSGAIGSVKKGIYAGMPLMPHRAWLKASALFARLPELFKRLRRLEDKDAKSNQKEATDND